MVDLLLQVIRFVAIRVLFQHKNWEARMADNFKAASIYSWGGGEMNSKWIKRLNAARGWILGVGLLLAGVAWLSSTLTR
jgi:hypothetical protein